MRFIVETLLRRVHSRSSPPVLRHHRRLLLEGHYMARPAAADRRPLVPNESLKLLLDEVGWRPETLARKVNAALQQRRKSRRVHEKTPYRWLRGEIPHPPVPDIVVDLLIDALRQPVRFDMVWPEATHPCPTWLWPDEDPDVPWDHMGLQKLLGEWSLSMLTRRTFLTLTGTALTGPAWQLLDAPTPIPARTGKGTQVPPPLMALIETMVVNAQQLDERHGSAAADFVASQFAMVNRLVRNSTYDGETGQRLCAALAQLAQTSGWMAQEAEQDGRAQRWYRIGELAAHCAGDHGLTASIMALMSNHATTLGQHHDALQLAAAATEAADQAPAAVQALIAARSSLAHAGAGDLPGVQRARDHAAELAEIADQHPDQRPTWAGYVTRTELDAITGRALVMLARHIPGRRRKLLIRDAETLLLERALDPSEAHQRSALRHGAYLSLAHCQAGDLDQAVYTGHLALQRLPMVTSARCLALLAELRSDLAPHAQRSRQVRTLISELDAQVPRSPGR
ncbi:hypothetical protein AB0F17_54080 [Nonomuraea sp. NPDC026600]|uniref:hypothetical protein n=1 Tax=Nonomuraea sp. NPDC026600 TaxID=3155363 RepID=UPI0033F61DEC